MLCCALILPASLAAAPKSTGGAGDQKTAAKPLDEQLLEGLSTELLEGLEPAESSNVDRQNAAVEESKETGKQHDTDVPGTTARNGLPDGEDIGSGVANPLVGVERRMRQVEQLLKEREFADPTTQAQKQIVTDLEALIEQLKCQQCQGSSSKSESKQASSKRNTSKSGAASGDPRAISQEGAARESSSRQQSNQTTQVERNRVDLDRFEKELWGDLPDRARQQMLNTSVDQFLPEYRDAIEKYFRRLVEEDSQQR
jgi:hypothetical protein